MPLTASMTSRQSARIRYPARGWVTISGVPFASSFARSRRT